MTIMAMTDIDSYDDYGDDNIVILKQISFPVSNHCRECQCQQNQG